MDTRIYSRFSPAQFSGHVALVDDDDAMRVALSRLLTVSKINCAAYASGRAFLTALPNAMPACLLLDVDMPDMTGIEVQEYLMSVGVRIPTVVLTGVRDDKVEMKAKTLGAAVVLYKPATAEALIQAIRSATSGT